MISFYLSVVETDEDRDKIVFIYENFYSFMCYSAGQVLKGNTHDVEDAVHNAMLKIIDRLDMIDVENADRAKYLCGIIARNTAKDHLKRKDNQTIRLDETFNDMPDGEPEPYEIVIRRDVHGIMLRAIRSLDERYRDVCILRYVHGYKEREISELLGLPQGTVSTRISRAKQILREELRKESVYV